MHTKLPKLDVSRFDSWTVVTFKDKQISGIDEVEKIKGMLFDLIDKDSGIWMVLNFGDVEYLSSSFLGVLVGIQKRIRICRGKLRLCQLQDVLSRILNISGLDKSFEIFSSLEEAVRTGEASQSDD